MNNSNSSTWLEPDTQAAASPNEYDETDKAVLAIVVRSLIGKPDIDAFIHKLGYRDERHLCAERNCRDLYDLFFRGDYLENIRALRREIGS